MKLEKQENKINIKFNALISPKVKWNAEKKECEILLNNIDFRHEMAKLLSEEGDTPEETKKLKRMHSSTMMNIHEAMEYIYGSLNDVENRHSYFKGEVVALPKEEADYYLNSFCGGEVTMRGMGGKLEKTHHKYNIDNQQGFYEKKDMARFHREHKPLAVAELYNG